MEKENAGTEMAVMQGMALPETNEQLVARVKGRVQTLQHIYRNIMVESCQTKDGKEISGDYGLVPGCGDKPALLKPGAEKLLMAFRVATSLKVEQTDFDAGHREIRITTTLTAPDGSVLGEGVGSCSTMESKYRYRNVADYVIQECEIPKDSKERKAEYRRQGFGMKKINGAWYWVKYGDEQRTENPDIADTYNTVLKMAKKRSIIDAVLTVFAASDIFTQDIDEKLPENGGAPEPEKPTPANGKPEEKPANGKKEDKPLTAFDMILEYKNAKAKISPAALNELNGVIDSVMNADPKMKDLGLRDCTPEQHKVVLDAITAHYAGTSKKAGK
jgi:hypothetical protein